MNIWRLFYSMRLALWLILLLALVSLAGALLQQMPSDVAADMALKTDWLEQVARPDYGFMADVYNFLGLFDVFHSPLFILLGSLLIINIAVCSFRRWPALVNTSRGIDLSRAARVTETDSVNSETTGLSDSETVSVAVEFLSRQHYRIRKVTSGNATLIVGDKNRFAPWGTYAIHLSLIILTAGYLIGGYFGFEHQSFIVSENETRPVENGYDVSLKLLSFEDEYWPDGTPKDYRSTVELIVNNAVVREGIIRVNHPMNYHGLKIYQASFGSGVVFQVTDGGNEELFHGSIALPYTLNEQGTVLSYGTLPLLEHGLYAFIITADESLVTSGSFMLWFYDADTTEYIGSVDTVIGKSVEFQGLTFTPESFIKYSVFQLKDDPGLPLIWIAFILFMAGLILVFYFPYRQLILVINTQDNRTCFKYTLKGSKGQLNEEQQALIQALGSTEP